MSMFRQRIPVFALAVVSFLVLILFALARVAPPGGGRPSPTAALTSPAGPAAPGRGEEVLYLVNRRSQEVHRMGGGDTLPAERNRVYLGAFTNCRDAVAEAKRRGFDDADGCYHCATECHYK